ncbi:MAG TPA: glucose-6-phosphate dehydrogenase [Solirubrobacterales bacterium]|jgi:glucose-6-phosphate 1-dehydrogenase|nr:glucose-6-phosphate dehydrogenase [Solirubrobacterales bacterium]
MAKGAHTGAGADVLAIFGISGDLAKKMTFQALYRLEAAGKLDCPIVGVAIDEWDDEQLRRHARGAIEGSVEEPDEGVISALADRLRYVQGDYADAETFERVGEALGEAASPVFYLEIPPSLFATVVEGLGAAGLTENAHVVIEKPFGHDLESARRLNAELCTVLNEDQILRIDHYLGKEPVMDISYLRFANSVLEPVWNRSHVSHVQMTIAENFGVEDRGRFYDAVGAMRDVIQNHAMQVLALVGMGPPTGNHPDSIRDKKLEFFKAMRAADPKRYVRGQYEGFLEVTDVAPDSSTETFAAVELEVDNWRWSGVPFFVRAGKCMPVKASEVTVVFKRPPPNLGIGHGKTQEPNKMTIRIEPEPGARMRLFAKKAGEEAFEPADLEVLFEKVPGEDPEPYERLLGDAIAGRHELFTRQDAIEETWRVVQPLLDEPGPVRPYEPGTWGPAEARDLTRGIAQWSEPWLPEKAAEGVLGF